MSSTEATQSDSHELHVIDLMPSDAQERLLKRLKSYHATHGDLAALETKGSERVKVYLREDRHVDPDYLPAGVRVKAIRHGGHFEVELP